MSLGNLFPKPDLENTLNNLKSDVMANMNCVNIGVIQSFNAANQTASVQVQIKRIDNISLAGVVTYKEVPVLLNVPVVVMFGGTGLITFPIAENDPCIVFFNDREIDNWYATGQLTAPITQRMHNISDGIALVGINSLQTSIQNYLTTGIRLALGTAQKIEITPGLIASLATLFMHTGDMTVTGDVHIEGGLEVDGTAKGTGGTFAFGDNVTATGKSISAGTLHAANGANGSGTHVTVVDGIVTAVS